MIIRERIPKLIFVSLSLCRGKEERLGESGLRDLFLSVCSSQERGFGNLSLTDNFSCVGTRELWGAARRERRGIQGRGGLQRSRTCRGSVKGRG